VVGPRGDGYRADLLMTAAEAQDYHSDQIGVFSGTEADMVSAITMNYAEEAIGIAHAARAADCRWRSHSPWRPTASCRPASNSERRSRGPMRKPHPLRRTT
jgi:hypothetical protein